MKAFREFVIGIVMTIVGAVWFLTNITVSGFYSGFFNFGNGMFHTGTGSVATIVVIMCICFFAMIVRPNFLTRLLMFISFLVFVGSILLGLRYTMNRMSALTLFFILVLFVGGLGLICKSIFGLNKEEKQNKDVDNKP